MAFKGYLVKLGNYEVDNSKFILYKTWSFNKNTIDVNSKRTGIGILRRNTLDHKPDTLQWRMPPLLTNDDMRKFFREIEKNYLIPKERKLLVTVYNPEEDDYETQEMYLEDPKFTINHTDGDLVIYEAVDLLFTGY